MEYIALCAASVGYVLPKFTAAVERCAIFTVVLLCLKFMLQIYSVCLNWSLQNAHVEAIGSVVLFL